MTPLAGAGVRRVDAGQLERFRVRPAGATVAADEVGGSIVHHGVELLACRHAARKGFVRPATADDPGLSRFLGDKRSNGLLNVLDGFGEIQIDFVGRLRSVREMHPGVVEARQHAAAVGVDDAGLRPAQAFDFAIGPDADDLIAADGHGFLNAAVLGRGVHLPIEHDEIDGAVVALGSGNDPGNDRCCNNYRDDDAGKACGHATDSSMQPVHRTGAACLVLGAWCCAWCRAWCWMPSAPCLVPGCLVARATRGARGL